jgi:excinuclease ABC subunit B
MARFDLVSAFQPTGDQPQAIDALVRGIQAGERFQTLLGVTGSGKTFTMANVIAHVGLPTLVLSHNKTLAAQLYGEFRGFFPHNAVEYFISYYDYYQPEAFVPATNTYIEKDSSINDDIERLRLRATGSLLSRPDVIVVASVSCIYGLGSPTDFKELSVRLRTGQSEPRESLLRRLVRIQYSRNDYELARGNFRVRGDVIEIVPAYEETAVRVELFGDEVEAIRRMDPLTGRPVAQLDEITIFPARHFVTPEQQMKLARAEIERDLDRRLHEFEAAGKLLEAQRLESRTRFDLEMMQEVGHTSGIENYSRYLSGRRAGERPACLLDYFPDDYLVIIDESHVTLPQVEGMYNADRSRKLTLVEHGFRLPSALDNRPLRFDEFERLCRRVVYVSATPGDYELRASDGVIVEQIIRPTGLMDPQIVLKPAQGQVDDLLEEIRRTVSAKQRVLVTTLTKRMAEDLTEYLLDLGIRVRYLHSDIEALERVEILRDLRLGRFDVLVGINLLREGLDLPEVALVAVLDADKEGFLRSETTLIQTVGRAARNVDGRVVMYAETITGSMQRAIDETNRRRAIQAAYNAEHGITPRSIVKSVQDIMAQTSAADARGAADAGEIAEADDVLADLRLADRSPEEIIAHLEERMRREARALRFENAASLRDRIRDLQARQAQAARAGSRP